MKKIIFMFFIMVFIFGTAHAGTKIAYEPEEDGAVSYSVSKNKQTDYMEMTFIKYMADEKNEEYWLRAWYCRPEHKFLSKVRLLIDGEEIPLQRIKTPEDKHLFAAASNAHYLSTTNYAPQFVRYYVITSEEINKILNAKKAEILFDTEVTINKHFNIDDGFRTKIKDAFAHTYSDFKILWKPQDESERGMEF